MRELEQRDLPRPAASRVAVVVELVDDDDVDAAASPSRSAKLARISAVQQMIGRVGVDATRRR